MLRAMIYATFAWNSRLTRESDIVNWFGSKGCMRCLICISMEQRNHDSRGWIFTEEFPLDPSAALAQHLSD
jgi:hypothetical protein